MLEQSKSINEIVDEIIDNGNIFLIGSSEYGEVNVPTLIPDLAYLYAEFGRRGTLIEAVENLLDDEVLTRNIYVVKTTGLHSKAILNVNVIGKDVIDSGVILRAKHANEKFDDVKITINVDSIIFNINGKEEIKYMYEDYVTVNRLAEKINHDTADNKNYIYMETYVDDTIPLLGALDSVNNNIIYLHAGNSGLYSSKNDLFISMKNTLDLLEGYQIDVLVPLGVYLDDIDYDSNISSRDKLSLKINNKPTSFYDLISNFINTQFLTGNSTIAVMGFNQNSNIDMENKFNILNLNKVFSSEQISNSFIVVSGNNIFNSKLSRLSNGQVELGNLISTSNYKESIVFKDLPNFYSSIDDFTNEELIKVSKNKIIAFRHSHYKNKTVVATSTTTSDCENKGFNNLQNIMTLQFLTKFLNKMCELYIGQDINVIMKNDRLKNNFTKYFTEIRTLQYINDFELDVEKISSSEIKIKVKIQSVITLEFLELVNSLRVSGNEVKDE